MSDCFRTGGPLQTIDHYNERVSPTDKLRALMTGLRDGESARYISERRQWHRVCEIRSIEPRLVDKHPGWGERPLDYILRLRAILAISSRTIVGDISSIRYFQLLAGYHESSSPGSHFRIVLKSMVVGIPLGSQTAL